MERVLFCSEQSWIDRFQIVWGKYFTYRIPKYPYNNSNHLKDLKPRIFIPLVGSTVYKNPRHSYQRSFVFKVVLNGASKSTLIAARSETEKENWISWLNIVKVNIPSLFYSNLTSIRTRLLKVNKKIRVISLIEKNPFQISTSNKLCHKTSR